MALMKIPICVWQHASVAAVLAAVSVCISLLKYAMRVATLQVLLSLHAFEGVDVLLCAFMYVFLEGHHIVL